MCYIYGGSFAGNLCKSLSVLQGCGQYQMLAGDGTAEWFSESAKKAKEERLRLFCEIQKPPMQMREVLMESIYFQMKDSEIGQLHGLTNENVHKIRSRAKQKLIERMKEGIR